MTSRTRRCSTPEPSERSTQLAQMEVGRFIRDLARKRLMKLEGAGELAQSERPKRGNEEEEPERLN